MSDIAQRVEELHSKFDNLSVLVARIDERTDSFPRKEEVEAKFTRLWEGVVGALLTALAGLAGVAWSMIK